MCGLGAPWRRARAFVDRKVARVEKKIPFHRSVGDGENPEWEFFCAPSVFLPQNARARRPLGGRAFLGRIRKNLITPKKKVGSRVFCRSLAGWARDVDPFSQLKGLKATSDADL